MYVAQSFPRKRKRNTLEAAEEIVAQEALECIYAHYNIIINGHNYHAFEVAKENIANST